MERSSKSIDIGDDVSWRFTRSIQVIMQIDVSWRRARGAPVHIP